MSKKPDGTVCQRITAEDIKNLPEATLRHVKVLEQSMDNHYSVWAAVYPQLALTIDPIAKAQTEQRLKLIVVNMKSDLDGILQFLLDCGLHLDDHYMHIRSVARSLCCSMSKRNHRFAAWIGPESKSNRALVSASSQAGTIHNNKDFWRF